MNRTRIICRAISLIAENEEVVTLARAIANSKGIPEAYIKAQDILKSDKARGSRAPAEHYQ